MNDKQTILTVAIGFVLFSGLLAFAGVRLGGEQQAWTSQHIELINLIDRCPGQHGAVKLALDDGQLQLREARTLIPACAINALGEAVD